jgi:hypothetical protein
VLAAIVGLFVNFSNTPLIVVAVVASAFVTSKMLALIGPAPAGLDDVVTDSPVPVVREVAVTL